MAIRPSEIRSHARLRRWEWQLIESIERAFDDGLAQGLTAYPTSPTHGATLVSFDRPVGKEPILRGDDLTEAMRDVLVERYSTAGWRNVHIRQLSDDSWQLNMAWPEIP